MVRGVRTRSRLAPPPAGRPSDGIGALLAGADAHGAADIGDPDLPVADLPATGGGGDGVDDLVGVHLVHEDLDLGLGHELDRVLGAAVGLGGAALAAEAPHLADGEAR